MNDQQKEEWREELKAIVNQVFHEASLPSLQFFNSDPTTENLILSPDNVRIGFMHFADSVEPSTSIEETVRSVFKLMKDDFVKRGYQINDVFELTFNGMIDVVAAEANSIEAFKELDPEYAKEQREDAERDLNKVIDFAEAKKTREERGPEGGGKGRK